MMKKIYILDDDTDFLDIVRHILSKNYLVYTAVSLNMQEIAAIKPDLILLDNVVGTDKSEEIISELYSKISFFTTPIILVSAHHNLANIAQTKGVRGYIQKPASINAIRAYIDDFFEAEAARGVA